MITTSTLWFLFSEGRRDESHLFRSGEQACEFASSLSTALSLTPISSSFLSAPLAAEAAAAVLSFPGAP